MTYEAKGPITTSAESPRGDTSGIAVFLASTPAGPWEAVRSNGHPTPMWGEPLLACAVARTQSYSSPFVGDVWMRFNLIDEPWLPHIRPDGHRGEFGIRDLLLCAHQCAELRDAAPPVTIALHRFLLALLQRACGPTTLCEWQDLYEAGEFPATRISAYLEEWYDRFWLFHDQWPFYQTAGMTTPKSLPVSSLFEELAVGNNPTLFDHSTSDPGPGISFAQAARGLVVRQGFALGLGVSPKVTIDGETFGTGSRMDGSLARGVILLLRGNSLFETLMLNLIARPEHGGADDLPIWERDTPEAVVSETTALGSIDLYTAQARRLRLEAPDADDGLIRRVYFAQGRKIEDSFCDPMKASHVVGKKKQKKEVLIGLHEDRASWRDSTALLEFARKRGRMDREPTVLRFVSDLIDEGCLSEEFRAQLDLFGVATQPGRATSVTLWRHDHLPLPLAYVARDLGLLSELKHGLEVAEHVARALRSAVRVAVRTTLGPGANSEPSDDDVEGMLAHLDAGGVYWRRLEAPFRGLIVDLAETEDSHRSGVVEAWFNQTLVPAAELSYDRTVGTLESSSRALRAMVTGQETLCAALGAIKKKHFWSIAMSGASDA